MLHRRTIKVLDTDVSVTLIGVNSDRETNRYITNLCLFDSF